MNSKLSGLLLLLLMLLPGAALAQTTSPTIDELTVELWPEFDRPEVLVIYRVTLSSGTSLPATLTFSFPPYVDSMHAIAVERNGGLFSVEENALAVNKTADALEVTLSVDNPKLQLEYYDPLLLTKQGGQRQLDYTFRADYPVTSARFQVQEPLEATDFSISPQASSNFTDQNGLYYEAIETAGLAPGDTVQLGATYNRTTDRPSVDLFTSQTPEHTADIKVITDEAPVSRQLPLGYILIGAGVLLLLVTGGYWWWSNRAVAQQIASARRPSPRPLPPKKQAPARPASRVKPGQEAFGGYCHQCGSALRADAKFCHVCGASRRTT